jgi:hypothetical protein
MPKTYDELAVLADDARPKAPSDTRKGSDDWASARQIDAENLFFKELKKMLPADRFAELEDWCLKATTEEMLDEGLRYARAHLGLLESAVTP